MRARHAPVSVRASAGIVVIEFSPKSNCFCTVVAPSKKTFSEHYAQVKDLRRRYLRRNRNRATKYYGAIYRRAILTRRAEETFVTVGASRSPARGTFENTEVLFPSQRKGPRLIIRGYAFATPPRNI